MLDAILRPLTFPPYDSVKQFEGKGTWAVDKYYKWPYRYFYRHKLRMIVDMLKKKGYYNLLDFGSGPGILSNELSKHTNFIKQVDIGDAIDPRWKYDAIVCASVLEFLPRIGHVVKVLRGLISPTGELIVASPMETPLSMLYFKFIKDLSWRHSHKTIIEEVSKHFTITEYKTWLGLYFSLKAIPR